MYLNGYSVRIPEGVEKSGGYVEMKHGTQYKLRLRNSNRERCDVYVEIDGKHVGTWRLNPHQSVLIERPAHDTGRFTFYELATREARKAGLVDGPELGLVKVVFTPEKAVDYVFTTERAGWRYLDPVPHWDNSSWEGCSYFISTTDNTAMSSAGGTTSCGHSPGGTGLSGESDQEFGWASSITHDFSRETTIHLRLVARKSKGGPRPLTSYSTPVPPRV
jgi:hypothetical protein